MRLQAQSNQRERSKVEVDQIQELVGKLSKKAAELKSALSNTKA
jgi:DNA anti-recombination protein RmuC